MQPFSQQHPSSSSNARNSAGNAQPQPNDVSITDPDASSEPQPQNVGPESGAAVISAHSPAAGMQPMPFPGPYAYAPMPAAMGQEGGCTGAAAQPASAGPATEDTTYSTSTASTATTSTSTSTLAPDANPDKLPPLILAARWGDLPALEALLQGAQADVNQVDGKYGFTALMFAAEEGHLEVVKMLLAAGATVNSGDARNGQTALMRAAAGGHVEVVKLLLGRQDIDLNRTTSTGHSALMLACMNGRTDVVRRLLDAGAAVNLVSPVGGETALICAAEQGHVDTVSHLLGCHGIDIDRPDVVGNNALNTAAHNNKPDVVACLLGAGADVNFVNSLNGLTALMWAATNGCVEVVKILVRQPGIDIHMTDTYGCCALHFAAGFSACPDTVAALLAAGAPINSVTSNNDTPLNLAAHYGQTDAVRLLLVQPGIRVDTFSVKGLTALLHAATNNHPDIVSVLAEAGASLEAVNPVGASALALALGNGHAAVIEVLLRHGASAVKVDFLPLVQTPSSIAIADLHADRDECAADLPTPDQAMAFFTGLAGAIQGEAATQDLFRWLHGKGIRMAAAQQVVELLASAQRAWGSNGGSARSARPQQMLAYCVAALSRMQMPGASQKVVEGYKAAGIAASAIARLSGVAMQQLAALAVMAEQAAAVLGGDMLDKLIPACLARTVLEYEVDSVAFTRSLADDGFCAPVAQAIALGWKAAIAALQVRKTAMAAGLTMAQVMQFMRKQTELQAPAEFALAMRCQLRSRDNLSQLQAMLGSGNDEGLHALFQVQCDQLLQYCEQLLEQESAHTG
jgi:ankyrin repeat protein